MTVTSMTEEGVTVGTADIARFVDAPVPSIATALTRWPISPVPGPSGAGHYKRFPIREMVVVDAYVRLRAALSFNHTERGRNALTLRTQRAIGDAVRTADWGETPIYVPLPEGVSLLIEVRWPNPDDYTKEA